MAAFEEYVQYFLFHIDSGKNLKQMNATKGKSAIYCFLKESIV